MSDERPQDIPEPDGGSVAVHDGQPDAHDTVVVPVLGPSVSGGKVVKSVVGTP